MKQSGKKLTFVMSVFPRLKASLERDFLPKKKILMRSHALTKQNVILVQKEIVISQVWKEDFRLMFTLKVGLWAQGGGGRNTQGKYLSSKF